MILRKKAPSFLFLAGLLACGTTDAGGPPRDASAGDAGAMDAADTSLLDAANADANAVDGSLGDAADTGLLDAANDAGTPAEVYEFCLLYTSPSPRDRTRSRMPSSA